MRNLTNDLSFSSAGGETAGPGGSRRTFGGLPRARELGLEVFVRF